MARNTRNKECKAPRPSTWDEHSVPEQGQACGPKQTTCSAADSGMPVPRRLRFG